MAAVVLLSGLAGPARAGGAVAAAIESAYGARWSLRGAFRKWRFRELRAAAKFHYLRSTWMQRAAGKGKDSAAVKLAAELNRQYRAASQDHGVGMPRGVKWVWRSAALGMAVCSFLLRGDPGPVSEVFAAASLLSLAGVEHAQPIESNLVDASRIHALGRTTDYARRNSFDACLIDPIETLKGEIAGLK